MTCCLKINSGTPFGHKAHLSGLVYYVFFWHLGRQLEQTPCSDSAIIKLIMRSTHRSLSSHSKSMRSTQTFRIVLKSRGDQRDQPNGPTESKFIDAVPNEQLSVVASSLKKMEPSRNISNIQQYVRERIKTEPREPIPNSASKIDKLKSIKIRQKTALKKSMESPSSSKSPLFLKPRGSSKSIKQLNMSGICLDKSTVLFRPEQPHSLKQIEDRVDGLIAARLSRLSAQPSYKEDQVMRSQLNSLIRAVKERKDSEDPEREDLLETDQRIRIIEKLIAEGATEGEIMKKFYLYKLSQPQLRASRHSQAFYNPDSSPFRETQYLASSFANESINHSDFRKPSCNDYHLYRYKDQFFNAGRHQQPLPRSSYSREFLRYGAQQQRGLKPNDTLMLNGGAPSHKRLATSYQQSFKPKAIGRVDYKQLDCFRNKFKNLPICFSFNKKKEIAPRVMLPKEVRLPAKLQVPQVTNQQLISESRQQYQASQSVCLRSAIKHQNLQRLKCEFKMRAMA